MVRVRRRQTAQLAPGAVAEPMRSVGEMEKITWHAVALGAGVRAL